MGRRASGRSIAAVGVGCAAVALLSSSVAHAFRTVADDPDFPDGQRITWTEPSVAFVLGTAEGPISERDLRTAFGDAANLWESSCSKLEFALDEEPEADLAGADGVNTVSWVAEWTDRYWDPTAPAQTDMQFECMSNGTWRIVEADIYLNAESFDWGVDESEGSLQLAGVLAHELGHVLGLLHPCDDGEATAACADAPEFEVSIMHPGYSTERAVPSDDDLAGLCFLYSEEEPEEPVEDVGECQERADCEPSLSCVDALCVEGDSPLGMRCQSHWECDSGACSEVCVPTCEDTSKDCGAGASCIVDEMGVGACVGGAREIGAECRTGDDCISSVCIRKDEDVARQICSARCSSAIACPSDWECSSLDGEEVCIPPPAKTAKGCSYASGSRGPAGGASGLVLAALTLLLRRSKIARKR